MLLLDVVFDHTVVTKSSKKRKKCSDQWKNILQFIYVKRCELLALCGEAVWAVDSSEWASQTLIRRRSMPISGFTSIFQTVFIHSRSLWIRRHICSANGENVLRTSERTIWTVPRISDGVSEKRKRFMTVMCYFWYRASLELN